MVGYSWWFGWIVKRFQRKIIEASVIWSGILFLQETLQMNWKKQGLIFCLYVCLLKDEEETITFLPVTLPSIHRFKKITNRPSNKHFLIWLLTSAHL